MAAAGASWWPPWIHRTVHEDAPNEPPNHSLNEVF